MGQLERRLINQSQPTCQMKTDKTLVEGQVHTHDLHATLLHLMGLDHERLTYRHAGRDYRLTDVAGEVVKPILA